MKIDQRILALVFIGTIVLTFVSTKVIGDYYDNSTDTTIVFTSDTDVTFQNYAFTDEFAGAEVWTLGCNYQYGQAGNLFFQPYNYTPAYIGNDTWAFSHTGHADTTTAGYVNWVFTLPNLDNWIMSGIDLSLLTGADAQQTVGIAIYTHEVPILTSASGALDSQRTLLFAQTSDALDYVNISYDVPLSQSLTIFDKAQENTNYTLHLFLSDDDNNGISAHTSKLTMTITGKLVGQWTLRNTLTLSNAFWASILTLEAIFLTDSVDWGKTTKDLVKNGRRKTPKSLKMILGIGGATAIFSMLSITASATTLTPSPTGTSIELMIVIPFLALLLFGALAYFEKLNWFVAGLCIAGSVGIAWAFADVIALLFNPLWNSIVYGFSFGIYEIITFWLWASMFIAIIIGCINLIVSKGKVIWG